MDIVRKYWFWLGCGLAMWAVAIGIATSEDPTPYARTDVQRYIERAADCHAEFFYTHDPQITGVGIADALEACDPFP